MFPPLPAWFAVFLIVTGVVVIACLLVWAEWRRDRDRWQAEWNRDQAAADAEPEWLDR